MARKLGTSISETVRLDSFLYLVLLAFIQSRLMTMIPALYPNVLVTHVSSKKKNIRDCPTSNALLTASFRKVFHNL